MSQITEQLRKEIDTLDLEYVYEEKVCMVKVSKDLSGSFTVIRQEWQECAAPLPNTLKAMIALKAQVTSHSPCDDPNYARVFDGDIQGELVFAYMDSGSDRGYHVGKFEWHGGDALLVGKMSGVTNAGTHRACEPCDQGGHMEGRLDAIVVEGKFEGGRLLAVYVISYDTSGEAQDTGFSGALEGVLILPRER